MKIILRSVIFILISNILTSLPLEYEKCPYQYNQTLKEQLFDYNIKNNFFYESNWQQIKISCNNIKNKFIKPFKKYFCFHKVENNFKKRNEKPKISVVVPVYNTEKYLRKCLNSLINQTFKNIEIILIDDESTDNSGNILDYYSSNEYILIVIHQKNAGAGCTRNIGIDLASGEYIHFVDSDDFLNLKTYEYIYRYAKKDDIDAIKIDYRKFYYKNDKYNENNIDLSDSPKENFLLNPLFDFYCWAYIFKLSLIKDNKLKFIHNLEVGEDIVFNYITAGAIKTIKKLPGKYYQYRFNDPNQTSNKPIMEKLYGKPNRPGKINFIKFVIEGWKKRGWLKGNSEFFLKLIAYLLNDWIFLKHTNYLLSSFDEEIFTEAFYHNSSENVKNILLKIIKMKNINEGIRVEI